MKILLCTFHETDCGLDNLYDGLCRVLGPENVFEYPEKPFLHGKWGRRWSWYPLFFDWPNNATEDQKLEMLKNNEFDYIFFSNRVYQHILHGIDSYIRDKYMKVLDLLINKTKTPIIILDQSDGTTIDSDLMDILNARVYFKRDYLIGEDYDSRITPLNLCYSEKFIPNINDINNQKTNSLFWIGKGYCGRTKYLNACQEITTNENFIRVGRASIICGQKQYSQRLSTAKIGLNLYAFGYDCMRYYEIPAHGVLLFSQRLPVVIENDYTDMQNAVFFDSIPEMKDKLKFLMANEGFVDKARIKGYEWMLNFHTTSARARQMLYKIKGRLEVA